MEKKYNFETPERVAYGGPWVSFVTAIFLFRAATGLGLFEAKTFVEANMNMNDQREVHTRELGEMIKAWWDEKGTPKRFPAQTQSWLNERAEASRNSRAQQDRSWEDIGPEDKVSQIQDEEAHEKVIRARQDGWQDEGPGVITNLGQLLRERINKDPK